MICHWVMTKINLTMEITRKMTKCQRKLKKLNKFCREIIYPLSIICSYPRVLLSIEILVTFGRPLHIATHHFRRCFFSPLSITTSSLFTSLTSSNCTHHHSSTLLELQFLQTFKLQTCISQTSNFIISIFNLQ